MKIGRIKSIAATLLLLAVLILPLIPQTVHAAPPDCYWVGDGGNWSDAATHWSNLDGGAPGAGNLPDATSDVHFTSNSFTVGGQSVTFTAGAVCKDISWVGVTNSPTMGSPNNLNISGSLLFQASGVTYTAGTWNFVATVAGKTITTNGKEMRTLNFNGVGGGWTLQDNLTSGVSVTSSGTIIITNGTFNLNGKTITVYNGGYLLVNGAGGVATFGAATLVFPETSYIKNTDGTINFNSSTGTLSGGGGGGVGFQMTAGTTDFGSAILTMDGFSVSGGVVVGGTSSLALTVGNFSGNGATYYDVSYQSASTTPSISGANTFHNLTLTSTAVVDAYLKLSGNQVVNNNLILNGNAYNRRLHIMSTALHTQRTITVNGTVNGQYVDFQDIVGAGSASWDLSAINSGDLGNNTNITFATPKTSYYVGGIGAQNWADNHWASTPTGSASLANYPLPQDTAVFGTNSITLVGSVITINENHLPNINAVDVTNSPTFTTTNAYLYGSLKLGIVTWTVTNTYFYGQNLSSQWSTANAMGGNVTVDVWNLGLVTQSGDTTVTGNVTLLSGVLDLNDYDITASTFVSSTTTYARTLVMGSGNLTLNSVAVATKWNIDAVNLTIIPETSTIIFTSIGANTGTFAGASKTYNNFTIQGSGNYTTTITGTNTFNVFKIDRSQAAKTISGAVTLTISELFVPVVGNTVVTITNTDFTKTSGVVCSDYLTISGSNAGGGATYRAGSHGTDSGGNVGWSFTDCNLPSVTTLIATSITLTSATLNGNLTSLGSFTTVYGFFQYDKTGTFAAPSETPEQSLIATGNFSDNEGGLDSYDTYYYRAVVRYNSSDYVYGATKTFVTETTTPPAPPSPTELVGGDCQYYAPISVIETAGVGYSMLPIIIASPNQTMVTGGFMAASTLDTRVILSSSSRKPHLMEATRIIFASVIPANSSTTLYLLTSSTLLTSEHVIVGYNGYITTLDDPALELVDDFAFTWTDVYLDTSVAANIISKTAAFTVVCDGAGTITATMVGTAATIAITPVPTGEYDLVVSADTTWLMIKLNGDTSWDGIHSARIALAGASVADNGNAWILMSNVTPYVESIALSIAGNPVLLYDPITMISGTTLPDRQGAAQNGAITWGANPAGIYVYLGSLTSCTDDTTSYGVAPAVPSDRLPEVPVSEWYGDHTVTKAATIANPIRPMVLLVSDNTTMSEIQVWRWYGVILLVSACAAIARYARGHQGITFIAAGAVIALLVAFDSSIFPMYLAVLSAGCIIGGLVSERSHQI